MKTILTIGDSMTGWSDLSHYIKWTHILEAMLEAHTSTNQWRVINRGIGGNTSEDLLSRMDDDIMPINPDIITLLISGNDAGSRSQLSREDSRDNLETIVTRLKGICNHILIMQYHCLPSPEEPEKAWTHLTQNNDLLAEVAQKHHLPLLPMNPIMEAMLNTQIPNDLLAYRQFPCWDGFTTGMRQKDLVGADGVHTSAGGELVYGKAIFNKLKSLSWL